MGRYILSLLFVLALSTTSFSQKKGSSKLLASCCEGGGRCTGSAYCTACTNCSGCKHCADNGGSCGVCSGGGSSRVVSYPSSQTSTTRKTKTRKSTSSSSSTSGFYTSPTNSRILYGTLLTVKTATLNVRTSPGKDYPVRVVLEKGDEVRCMETSSAEWVKIEVVDLGIEGYVFAANLKK